MAGVSEVFNLDFKFGGNAEFLTRLEGLLKRIDSNFDSTTENINEATEATSEMADAVDELSGSFKNGISSLNSFGEKLKDIAQYYISFQAIRSGAERVWSFGMESMNAFATQERAENQLKGVLQNRGSLDKFDEIKSYASDIQGRTIYGDEAMIKGAGELATYVQGTESLKSMMDLLTNYAAGMTGGGEVSPEQMESLATGLGMAYDGNYMALRRKGFDTSMLEALDDLAENGGQWNAKLQRKWGRDWSDEDNAMFQGFVKDAKGAGGITENMKVEALKWALSDWDNLAGEVNKLDSSAIVRFNNAMGDLREEVGKRIYPTFNRLVASVEKHMPDIERMFDAIGDCFKRLAETLESNLNNLIDFGKWLADAIPDMVEFGSTIVNAVGKVVGLSDAMKYLISYMAAEKVREFADAIRQLFHGDEKGEGGLASAISSMKESFSGEKGLIGSLRDFGQTAAGAQIAVIGITWGLKQIADAASAFRAFIDEKGAKKERDDEFKKRDTAVDQMINAKKAYKAGTLTEDEYKKKFEFYNKVYGGGFTGSHFDIWSAAKAASSGAQTDAKSNSNIANSFNTTNIEQRVNIAADMQKIGILLNQNIRAIIESQMRQNREVSMTRGA